MLHSVQTAEKHYFIRNREKIASKAGDIVHSHFYQHQLSPVTPPKRKVWTEKEETLIKSVVNVNGSTNMSAIKERTPKLSDIQASPKQIQASPKQIYDKVRSLNRYSPAKSKQEKQKQVKLFSVP